MFLAFKLMRNLSALMVSVALLMLSNSLLSTLLALRGKIEGYSNEFIGLTMSAYFIGFCIGTFRSGPLINRVGHIRSFAAFGAIAAVLTAIAAALARAVLHRFLAFKTLAPECLSAALTSVALVLVFSGIIYWEISFGGMAGNFFGWLVFSFVMSGASLTAVRRIFRR